MSEVKRTFGPTSVQHIGHVERWRTQQELSPLNMILRNLEGTKTFARLFFIDFSSVFDGIQPHIIDEKLQGFYGLDSSLTRSQLLVGLWTF